MKRGHKVSTHRSAVYTDGGGVSLEMRYIKK